MICVDYVNRSDVTLQPKILEKHNCTVRSTLRGEWIQVCLKCFSTDLAVYPRVNVYNRSVGGIRCFRDLQTLANYARKAEMK